MTRGVGRAGIPGHAVSCRRQRVLEPFEAAARTHGGPRLHHDLDRVGIRIVVVVGDGELESQRCRLADGRRIEARRGAIGVAQ